LVLAAAPSHLELRFSAFACRGKGPPFASGRACFQGHGTRTAKYSGSPFQRLAVRLRLNPSNALPPVWYRDDDAEPADGLPRIRKTLVSEERRFGPLPTRLRAHWPTRPRRLCAASAWFVLFVMLGPPRGVLGPTPAHARSFETFTFWRHW